MFTNLDIRLADLYNLNLDNYKTPEQLRKDISTIRDIHFLQKWIDTISGLKEYYESI